MAVGLEDRFQRSLGLLTNRFVQAMQEAEDGVLDLNYAAELLGMKHKRRIYDITNVMEGFGVIEKAGKNKVQWKGGKPGVKTPEYDEKLTILKDEVRQLEEYEKQIEEYKSSMLQSLHIARDEGGNSRLYYLQPADLTQLDENGVVLAIKAPPGCELLVRRTNPNLLENPKYEMSLKSTDCPIQVFYKNDVELDEFSRRKKKLAEEVSEEQEMEMAVLDSSKVVPPKIRKYSACKNKEKTEEEKVTVPMPNTAPVSDQKTVFFSYQETAPDSYQDVATFSFQDTPPLSDQDNSLSSDEKNDPVYDEEANSFSDEDTSSFWDEDTNSFSDEDTNSCSDEDTNSCSDEDTSSFSDEETDPISSDDETNPFSNEEITPVSCQDAVPASDQKSGVFLPR